MDTKLIYIKRNKGIDVFEYTLKNAIGRFKFSVTIIVDEVELLDCLKMLISNIPICGNKHIVCASVTKKLWKENDQKVTFRFISSTHRDTFLAKASRFINKNLWEVYDQDEDDSPH